jgi:hypothetical protein
VLTGVEDYKERSREEDRVLTRSEEHAPQSATIMTSTLPAYTSSTSGTHGRTGPLTKVLHKPPVQERSVEDGVERVSEEDHADLFTRLSSDFRSIRERTHEGLHPRAVTVSP